MKTPLLVCILSLATAGLQAAAPHPSVLTVKYGDKLEPVVRVVGTDPVIMVDAREKRIRSEPLYLVQRAEAFGEGFVQMNGASLALQSMSTAASADAAQVANGSGMSSESNFGTTYFEVTLRSRQELKGGFAVVVTYGSNRVGGRRVQSGPAQVIVHDLPDLPAGKDVPVKFNAALIQGGAQQTFFIQLFDGSGREILTNKSDEAWQFYAMSDRAKLDGAIRKYCERNPAADVAAKPVLMAQPVFKDGLTPPKTAGSALLEVAADGTVAKLEITGIENEGVKQSIAEALNGWLFYPRLRAGVPVASKVQIPLQF